MDELLLHAAQRFHTTAADFFWLQVSLLARQETVVLLWIFLWCAGPRRGWWPAAIFLISLLANEALKEIIDRPRPAPPLFRSVGTDEDRGFAWPSGHSQNAMLLYGILALQCRGRAARAALFAVPLLVGFSRLYLGRHWPTDVLGGWGIGLALLAVVAGGERLGVPEWLSRPAAAATVAAAALSIAALHGDESVAGAMSILSGGSVGYAVEQRYLRTPAVSRGPGMLTACIWRAGIGLAGCAALFLGLTGGSGQSIAHRIAASALVGLWVTLLAPALFRLVPRNGAQAPIGEQPASAATE